MSSLAERIAQFRNMTENVPDDELGHFRLGQLLADDNQFAEAAESFAATVELAPTFSKAYQLWGDALIKQGDAAQAAEVLTRGYKVADERGDRTPREAIGQLLTQLGAPIPVAAPKVAAAAEDDGTPGTGFTCHRPACAAGKRATPLSRPPIPDPIGERVQRDICSACWDSWKKDFSVKVINELRLDLSSESGAAEYDRHMREYFGFEDEPAPSAA